MIRSRLRSAFVLGMLALAARAAGAATWTGAAGDGNWSNNGNWLNNTPPLADQAVNFDANTTGFTVNVNVVTTRQSLNLNAGLTAPIIINVNLANPLDVGTGGITINAQNLTINGPGAVNVSASETWSTPGGALTVGTGVTNGASTLTVSATANVTINGAIGSGAGGVTKTGAGKLVLAGANTYTGATTVSTGTLQVGGTGNSFRYYRFLQTALRNINNVGAPATANSIQLSEMQVFNGATQLTVAVATNPGGSSPAGGAEDPIRAIDNNLATKWLDFNKGALVLDMGSSVVVDNYKWGTANDAQERDPISWVFSGSTDNVTFVPLDTQTNFATTTTRNVIVGTFPFVTSPAGTNNIATSSAVTVAAGASITFINNQSVTSLAGAVGSTASITSGVLTVGNATNTTFSGTISGAGSLTKVGAGSLTLAVANTYSGGTTVTAGTLTTGHIAAMGTGTVTLNGGTLSLAGAALATIQLAGTGWNADVVRATGDPAITPFGTDSDVDGVNYIFYEAGVAGAAAGTGLPTNRSLTNAANGVGYTLQPYTGSNVLRVVPQATVALTGITNGANLNTIYILDTGGSGSAPYSFTLGFSDSSSTLVTGASAPDWFNNSPFVTSGVGREVRTTGAFEAPAGNPRLYEFAYTLSAADSVKTLTSITFNNTAAGPTTPVLDVFAISASTPGQNQVYLNNVVVTAGSTINVVGSPSATLGTLSIGASSLGITGGAVTLGATTFTGNSSFIVPIGTSLTLGTLSDGGTTRTLTKTGTGVMTLNGTASALTNTVFNLNAGTLNLNGAGALGTLTNLNHSSLATLNINANQTLSAWNTTGPAGGTANLNGKVLTVGSTDNLDSAYSGVIADGTGAAGTGGLVKAGTGTLTLSGASTYTGTTTVAAGRLQMNGSLGANAGVTTVQAAGTLGGTGSVRAIVVNGTVAPGTVAAAGTLTATAATFNNTSKLALRVPSLTAGAFDLLNMAGGSGLNFTVVVGAQMPVDLAGLPAASNGEIAVVNYVTGTGSNFIPSFLNGASNPNHTVSYRNVGTPHKVQIAFGSTPPTPVTLDGFTAANDGAGVLLSWKAVSEFQNIGFNVYRRASHSSWTRVNEALIAGRITHPDCKAYALYDWAPAGNYEYKLESVSIAGVTEAYGELAGPVSVDAASAVSSEGLAAASSSAGESAELGRARLAACDGQTLIDILHDVRSSGSGVSFSKAERRQEPAKALASSSVRDLSRIDAEPVSSRGATPAAGTLDLEASARWFTRTRPSARASANVAKVVYNAPGVLFIPQAALPAGFDAGRVSITREDRAMTALAVTSGGVLVYAPGYEDEYTNKDALFLRAGHTPTPAGQAISASGLFAPGLAVNTDSPAVTTSEYHDVYFDYSLRPFTFAPWFSAKYLASNTVQRFTIETPGASGGAASLTVNLWSLTEAAHGLQVLVNGKPAGEAQWSGGGRMMQLTFQVDAGALTAGANAIDLITGGDTEVSLLHSITANYTRQLTASGPVDVFNHGSRGALFEVGGMTAAQAWVVDARFPERAALVASETQRQADGTYTLRFNAGNGGTGRFLVVPVGQENRPLSVSKRALKPVAPTPYISVGPAQFGVGVQKLLARRAKEGLRGSFAEQEQVFDYYNFGRFGPAGIQKMVQANRPRYLMLLGRTTYDYRNYTGSNVDPLCPAFLAPTSYWAQTTSDSMFGDMGRGYPEVAVGRLPVNNAGELNAAVSHILAYKGMSSGMRLHAVTDRADPNAGDFAGETEAMAQSHPDIAWQRNYLGITWRTSPEVTAAMKDAANGGADLILYSGHGNASRLGNEAPRILNTDSVQEWTGNVVFLQATCTANWMAQNENGYKSIAIQALTQPQGGISASIASSTYMNSQIASEFMSQLLVNAKVGSVRWGDALLKSQQWAHGKGSGYTDLTISEQIFGDPAMPVGLKPAAETKAPAASVAPGQF